MKDDKQLKWFYPIFYTRKTFSSIAFTKKFIISSFVIALIFETIIFRLIFERIYHNPTEGDELAVIVWARQAYSHPDLFNFPSSNYTSLLMSRFKWDLISVRFSVYIGLIATLLLCIATLSLLFRQTSKSGRGWGAPIAGLLSMVFTIPLMTVGGTLLLPSYHTLSIISSWIVFSIVFVIIMIPNGSVRLIAQLVLGPTLAFTILLRPSQFFILIVCVSLLLTTRFGTLQKKIEFPLIFFVYVIFCTAILVFSTESSRNIQMFSLDHLLFKTMPIHTLIGNFLFSILTVTTPLLIGNCRITKKIKVILFSLIVMFEVVYLLFYLRLSQSFLLSLVLVSLAAIFAINIKITKIVIYRSSLLTLIFASYTFGSYGAIRDSIPSQLAILAVNFIAIILLDSKVSLYDVKFVIAIFVSQIYFVYCATTGASSPFQQFERPVISKETQNIPLTTSSIKAPEILFLDLSGFYGNWKIPYFNVWVTLPHVFPQFFLENEWNKEVVKQKEYPLTRVNRFKSLIFDFGNEREIRILVSYPLSEKLATRSDNQEIPISQLSNYSQNLFSMLFPEHKLCIANESQVLDLREALINESQMLLTKLCSVTLELLE